MHSRNLARGTRCSKKGNARVRSVRLSDLAWNKLDSWAAAQGLGVAEALEHWAQEPPGNGAKGAPLSSFPQPMHGRGQASDAESNQNLNSIQSEIRDKLLVERSGELEQLNRVLEERILDLQIMHQQLRESERRFTAIFNQTFQFVGLLDPTGILLEANQTALDFGGIPREEVMGRPIWETHWFMISPQTQQRLREAIQVAVRGEFVRYEVDVLGKSGAVATIDFSLKPIADETGQVVLLIPEGRDITERLRVERALVESEHKYRAIFECSPLGISITDEAGNLVETNPMAERLLGVSQEDQLERTIDDGRWRTLRPDGSDMPREEYPSVRALKGRHLIEGVQQGIEQPDGSVTWLLVSAVPIPIAGYGVAIGYIDLTDRVKAEQALEASERRFEAAFEAAAVGMVIATPDGVFTRVNRALESFLGCEPGELVGRTFQDITHSDDFEGGLSYRKRLLAGEIEAYQRQKRYIRKDRTCAWGQLSLSLIYSGTGVPLHFVGLIEDINARAVAESLRRNLEEKELLLREIHHRVKNNLQVVASLLGLQAVKLGNTAAEALADSQQRINSIALVHEHLYRSEGLAGVEFYAYLERLTQMLFTSHGELAKRVCLELDVEAAMLDIDCAVPLGLVVNELVSNALKHAFPNGRTGQVRVELKATASGGWRLVVEDDGIGFAPQISSTPITLGLKLLRSLARQLDAEVSWQELPKGTRCEIQFSSCPPRSNET